MGRRREEEKTLARKRHDPFHLSPLPPGSPLITIFLLSAHFLDDLARGYEFTSILDISTVDITMQRVASQRALIHKHSSYVFPNMEFTTTAFLVRSFIFQYPWVAHELHLKCPLFYRVS